MELVLAVFVFGDWLSGFWSYSLIHMYFFYKEFRSDSKGFGIVNNCCLINTSRLIAKTLQSNSASLISASHLWRFFLYWILDSAGCHLVAFLILSWNCWSTATISLFGGNLIYHNYLLHYHKQIACRCQFEPIQSQSDSRLIPSYCCSKSKSHSKWLQVVCSCNLHLWSMKIRSLFHTVSSHCFS